MRMCLLVTVHLAKNNKTKQKPNIKQGHLSSVVLVSVESAAAVKVASTHFVLIQPEMSHRSSDFSKILSKTKNLLVELL